MESGLDLELVFGRVAPCALCVSYDGSEYRLQGKDLTLAIDMTVRLN